MRDDLARARRYATLTRAREPARPPAGFRPPVILFAHNRYRVSGGEERVVEDLMWLVRERLGRPVQLIARESAGLGRGRAALGLLRGGLRPEQVAAAVRESGASILHAHNLHPQLGWRVLAAARQAGAKVVLHLHQYRLVCAVGVCFTEGAQCTRCHGRNTLPGVLHRCRGGIVEAAVYGAALALWQRRMLDQADVVIVPSEAALRQLRQIGAPLPERSRIRVLAPVVRALEAEAPPAAPARGGYALLVSRVAPEKGVDVAVRACLAAGRPLVVAGDGPDLDRLRAETARAEAVGAGAAHAQAAHDEAAHDGAARAETARAGGPAEPPLIQFLGAVPERELVRLRAGAALALAPSRSAETFGLAAAEAMAAGLPLIASDVGFLSELAEPEWLVPAGDAQALAVAIERLWGDGQAGARARSRVAQRCAPDTVAAGLAGVYERALAARAAASDT